MSSGASRYETRKFVPSLDDRRIRLGLTSFGRSTAVPTAPASGLRFLFGSCNLVGSGRGMAVMDVGMGSTRTGRFD